MEFAKLLTRLLDGIDLGSRSSSKFAEAAAALTEHLQAGEVVIKALAAPKNYGNRISEGTGTGASVLVLLGREGVDFDAVRRAYVARAVRHVPTLVCEQRTDRCAPLAVLFSDHANPFPASIPAHHVAGVDAPVPGPDQGLLSALRALDGLSEREFEERVAGLSVSGAGVIYKAVGDAKNLRNRVREAAGRRPAVLVLAVESPLERAAFQAVSESLPLLGAGFVAVRRDGVVQLRAASSSEGDPEMPETPTEPRDRNYLTNRTVAELVRYLPFDASAGNLYEEHVRTSQRLEFETAALQFVGRLAAEDGVSMVVLTGNAGHGKTHLCRRLITEAGVSPADAMKAMSDDLSGMTLVQMPETGRSIRILKDLSEIEPVEVAAARLEELMKETDVLAIVCANEGRLRHVASRRPETLGPLVEILDEGMKNGSTSLDSSIHVVNLNYQAVTPRKGPAFLDSALDHWVGHGNRWRKCSDCRAADLCPIVSNRNQLSLSPDRRKSNEPARRALVHLVRLAEQSGYVLTLREALIFVSFLITGGLRCEDVHRRHRVGDLAGFDFVESLFSRELDKSKLSQLGVLGRIRRFDPGTTACRSVDEELHRRLEDAGGLGEHVLEATDRPPSTRDQLVREQRAHREKIRLARRIDYFGSGASEDAQLSARLGLRHHDRFLRLQEDGVEDEQMLEVLERLVRGLHAVQGIRVADDSSSQLLLVDPAFSRSGNRSAVIAHRFDQTCLELVAEASFWKEANHDPRLLEAVDWLDRKLLLAYRDEDASQPVMLLGFDLLQFEFVMRAADGVVFQSFWAAERKRVITRLGRLAEEHRDTRTEIHVMEAGVMRRLILERDNSFRVARS